MANNGISRRYFFYGSLLAGAVPVAGFGSKASLKMLGYKSPNEKLNIASIGAGGKAASDIRGCSQTENIVALCDVDDARAKPMFETFAKAPKYKDWRVMLDKEQNNIDAVIVTIPDHMHAAAATACMQRGKHVYVQKPLAHTIWENRQLAETAAKYKVATQMGNQGYSHESIRTAAEIVWSGEVGDVTEVHVSASPGTHPTGLQEAPAEKSVPGTLDWDLWLGDAAMRPYAAEYTPYNWRGFFDFGTGQIGNWGIHTMGPVNLALQLGAPVSVELVQDVGRSKLTFPERAVLKFNFPARGEMPPVTIFWHDSARPEDPEAYHLPGLENEMLLPPSDNLGDKGRGRVAASRGNAPPRAARPAGAPRTGAGGPGVPVYGPGNTSPAKPGILTGNGAVFVGSKGIMATVARGEGVHLLPEARWKEYVLPPPLLTRSPGHMLDWVRACKGGDPSCSDFKVSAPFAEWMVLGVIAFRVPGRLDWDSKNLRFTNSAEANRYVKPQFRKGWELKL